ncbi:GNAT family N-acetyltransferase [Flavobacterium sp. MC2016-06]|uniref:GNAT family N-acetyltransferase n=1 Tax=Flavobacterium sp. MC2016-06 TaxID=2676308 RepID=UPI0012BB15B4|nr:GNAT family N-acetyltransferase [Flavobacterium sp. MC2016-06]MBU3858928.1 GNAT family N-acetyltransferase [Flavobacterium sp. MC2016-06]
MNIVQKEVLSLQDKEVLCELWNNEYPEKLSYQTIEDFNLYLDGLINTKHYLLIDDENKIRGWAFTFFRDEEDWFAIILDEKIQGNGFGSLLIKELKKNKTILNGWAVDHENDVKRNKEFYKSPLMFYIKNGFTICENSRIENQKISAVKINWKL